LLDICRYIFNFKQGISSSIRSCLTANNSYNLVTLCSCFCRA